MASDGPIRYWLRRLNATRAGPLIHLGERVGGYIVNRGPYRVSPSTTPVVIGAVRVRATDPTGYNLQESAGRLRFSQGWPTHVVSDTHPPRTYRIYKAPCQPMSRSTPQHYPVAQPRLGSTRWPVNVD